jgi:UDP-GlcNAc:undecaprenyl-phosphate GlcNAc-1-phosphate transferase
MLPLFLLAAAAVSVAFSVTVLATPLVRRVALKQAWTDHPDGHRKFHVAPTPSSGGIAIFAGVAAATAVVVTALPQLGLGPLGIPAIAIVGGVLVMVLGAIDDVRGLDFKTKLAVETLVAYMLLHAGLRIDLSVLPFVGEDVFLDALYSIPLTIVWVVGVMNAVNLIDGIDGLASGVVAIAFASMALAYGLAGDLPLVFVALVFVGALIGFLVHNFNPASIFMGDSGSLFLGYALAVYTLSGPIREEAVLTPALPLLALGLPLLDTSLSMVRRASSRRAIMAPDHDHIHHRMSRVMSTRKAVAVLYGISAMFGLLAVLADSATGMGLLIALGCAAAVATGLLIRLGYVRLPYAPPALKPVPFPTDTETPGNTSSDTGPRRSSPSVRRQASPEHPSGSFGALP